MAEFLRFWQRLPRFAFGLASLLMWTAALADGLPVTEFGGVLLRLGDETLAKIVSGVLLVVLTVGAGAVGVFFLDLLVGVFSVVFQGVARWKLASRAFERLGLAEVAIPVVRVSLNLYKREREEVLSFYRLRSEASTGHEKDPEALKRLFESVGKHLDAVDDPALFLGFAYWHTLTQDQAKLEEWEFSIKDLYYLLLFLSILLLLGLRRDFPPGVMWSLLTLLVLCTVMSIPLVRHRKRRLAVLLLAAYCDNFTVAEGATVEDRAGA